MTETPFEEVIEEQSFAQALSVKGEPFFRLGNTLLGLKKRAWNKRHFFQLVSEANELESFLDDYGARYNRTYNFLTELVASMRGIGQVACSISHLESRLGSYEVASRVSRAQFDGLAQSVARVREFCRRSICKLLRAAAVEARAAGVVVPDEGFPEESIQPVTARERLPRNVDEEEINDEQTKIAEVASKFLQAREMLEQVGVARLDEAEDRRTFLSQVCTEEQARVYEATVHNLQSAYDTYIKNTVLESGDDLLPHLRGYASISLHLLEAVTDLSHFYERHENDIRSEKAKSRIAQLVDRGEVQDMILNHLLFWAWRYMDSGRAVANELLKKFTNVKELRVELSDDIVLHARPAALIVDIVNRYGTPVEMQIGNQHCNAGSILELLVAVGSHPDQHEYVFRGDENPLRDIGLLFSYGLGEGGLENLPAELSYLRAK